MALQSCWLSRCILGCSNIAALSQRFSALLLVDSFRIDQQRTYIRKRKKKCPPPPRNSDRTQYKWNWAALAKMLQEDYGGYTTKPLRVPRLGGRDPETGKKINQRVGGGIKWDFFVVSKYPPAPAEPDKFYEEKVLEVRKDPNRTAHIALVAGEKGRRWMLATQYMKEGQLIRASRYVPPIPVIRPSEGDIYPVGALPVGTLINNVERRPGDGSGVAQNAGTCAVITKRLEDMIVVRMPSKQEMGISPNCMATVGRLSNVDHYKEEIGNMWNYRRMGKRPSSGLWHRKDGYCGRKVRPLPPMKTYLEPALKDPGRLELTLTTSQLSAEFGPKKYLPLMHN